MYNLLFNVTSFMVPRITIYAHHIKNMKFGGRLKDIVIRRSRPNSIEITNDNEAKPGSTVNINVTTDEGSYVGLMGLDRSSLKNVNQMETLNEDYVKTILKSVNSEQSYPTPLYGATGDVITFSNVLSSDKQNPSLGELPILQMPEVTAKILPESWLFKDFQRTPAGGFTFKETTPDAVTNWAITGFSLHPDTGLTFTKNTTDIEVVQQLSVSFDLPCFMREGEIIEIPIFIRNYMNKDVIVNVTIESDSEDLGILKHSEDISTPQKNISKLLPGKKSDEFRYFLKPVKSGLYNILVKAISSSGSDTTLKTLNVIPRGISYTRSKRYLVHLLEKNIQEDEINIDIPENSVPGSQIIGVSAVGDIFGHLIENLQKLSQGPYMNTEDNMKLIVANSIVLKYLKTLNYLNTNLESKIQLNLELGYQNQLTFKYSDGSFGLFEQKIGKTGDIWHTAFALWGLKKANEFIHIDPKVINGTLNYLRVKQQANGCYKSNSGLEEDVKSTAFVLMVLLMDETLKTAYNETITKGLECLYESSKNLEHSASSFMTAYVLILGNHEKAENVTKKLTSGTHFLRKQMTWTSTNTIESYLEVFASSFMNLIESQEISDQSSLRVLRGLIDSKTKESSIYHIIALQAMVGYLKKSSLLKTYLKIRFKDDHHNSGDFRIDAENLQVLQGYEVNSIDFSICPNQIFIFLSLLQILER
ncbi:thioester-containing protein 1 allele R1-like [Episyrphus balteatus]|uniref:thioester-containing protein 1 allele R1-like n=1 Tax=Episyrphus balteatus TaxID=286459 RepID=UPI002485A3A7|nr:thioester-containing protein 1 allele R1-like [Episyrphus balteatus]